MDTTDAIINAKRERSNKTAEKDCLGAIIKIAVIYCATTIMARLKPLTTTNILKSFSMSCF